MNSTRDWNHCTITVDQQAYSESMLKRFGSEDCNSKKSPMTIGSLKYPSCGTRPVIALAVNQCAQYMSNPGPSHIEAAKSSGM